MEPKERAIAALKGIKEQIPAFITNNNDWGICYNLKHLDKDSHDIIREQMEQWPERTGSDCYPVPHPTKTPADAFNQAEAYEMWSPNHPYGAARNRLLDWMIEELSK